MRKLIFASLLSLAPLIASAADVTGVWKTEPNEEGVSGLVQISVCGNAYCGVMIGNTSGTDTYKGTTIVSGMQPTGDGNFINGKITDPTKDKTYNSKMSLSGDVLKVSGCVLGGTICRAQTWTRN